ncbi:putative DNA-J protein [Trypanosoma conorhini]|uniref:Putative DNA-J protein n=1 Tax=Trypanosoma conorhini TaxID=83891 RepID=A0A3R7N0N4_9TRYP|nr:putative DNA-J protein [Trypanosoma conorhini]RNF14042.1 putative DNA-J protein [Trypanosoma conorhini]
MARDPFAVLGLGRGATKAEIKTRYRELARLHHPDAPAGNSEKMEQVNKAYNLLIKEGAYERMRMRTAGAKARTEVRRPSPVSQETERQREENDAPEEALSEEEIAKVSALDPATERVTPAGKYLYQSRDDGSWMELDKPLVRAHQARYASYAAQTEMSEELRRRSLEKEKEENAKTMFQRAVDRLSDSADLPSRNPSVLRFCFLLALVVVYFAYQRACAWGNRRRSRADFYASVDQKRQELLDIYNENRTGLETSVAAAAILFLAASQNKQETDPVVPPTPEKLFRGVRPPREHFYVISGG